VRGDRCEAPCAPPRPWQARPACRGSADGGRQPRRPCASRRRRPCASHLCAAVVILVRPLDRNDPRVIHCSSPARQHASTPARARVSVRHSIHFHHFSPLCLGPRPLRRSPAPVTNRCRAASNGEDSTSVAHAACRTQVGVLTEAVSDHARQLIKESKTNGHVCSKQHGTSAPSLRPGYHDHG
jgi:hypothetical protein